METKDHFHLAKLITANDLFGTPAQCTAFEYGCISPDINPLTYIKGHTYSATIGNVKKMLQKLHGKLKSPADYFQLGRAVHFIGDYFTFPHTPLFSGSLSEHRSYESCLHRLISEENTPLGDISAEYFTDADKCIGMIERLHKKYSGLKNSISTDWSFIRYACAGAALSAAKSKFKIPEKSIVPQEFTI